MTAGVRSGWDGTTGGLGFTVPIPVRIDSDAPSPVATEGAPRAHASPYEGQPKRVERDVLFLDLSGWWSVTSEDSDEVVLQEYLVGLGFARTRHTWRGGSFGLSIVDASLEDSGGGTDRRLTWGVYGSLAYFSPFGGGLGVRLTLAPDVELGGADRAVGGVTFFYWFGLWALETARHF